MKKMDGAVTNTGNASSSNMVIAMITTTTVIMELKEITEPI
jgi:hypothetical protein